MRSTDKNKLARLKKAFFKGAKLGPVIGAAYHIAKGEVDPLHLFTHTLPSGIELIARLVKARDMLGPCA